MRFDPLPRTKPFRAHRPDLHQLETFLKVVEALSFTGAARLLGCSQPAVSQTIARLEGVFGGDLFVRGRGKQLALTPIGRAILPKAKLLLFTVDQQIERAVATAQSMTGSLTIGFYPGLAAGPLGAGINAFRKTRPDVELRLVESSPSDLYRQLNERTIDIIFTALLPELSGGANSKERLWQESFVLAMRNDHPLVAKDWLRWADISPLSIILRSHQGDLLAYRAIASRVGDRRFECDLHDVSFCALIEMVRLGLGITIAFASEAFSREGITFRPVIDDNAHAWVEAIWPKDDRNPLRHRVLTDVRRQSAPNPAPAS